jgi:hypothetical protein
MRTNTNLQVTKYVRDGTLQRYVFYQPNSFLRRLLLKIHNLLRPLTVEQNAEVGVLSDASLMWKL